MAIVRFGPIQFIFTLFLFYTDGLGQGITALGIAIVGSLIAALAAAPLLSKRLREAMVKFKQKCT